MNNNSAKKHSSDDHPLHKQPKRNLLTRLRAKLTPYTGHAAL